MSENNHKLECINHQCKCKGNTTAIQSLDEMDFERGIWNAAHSNDLDRVKQLIESNKYDVNQKDSAGYTALHYAARNGNYSICKYLIDRGIDVNSITKAGQATALHRACSAGKINIVVLLLSTNVNVYLKDADGKTALERAYNNKHFTICKLLLEKYPDLINSIDDKQKLVIFDTN